MVKLTVLPTFLQENARIAWRVHVYLFRLCYLITQTPA